MIWLINNISYKLCTLCYSPTIHEEIGSILRTINFICIINLYFECKKLSNVFILVRTPNTYTYRNVEL